MFTCTLWEASQQKMLGETWANVIKAINSILWTSMASRCSHTGMVAEPGSVCGQKGTMKDIFARCLKRADVQVCTLSCVYINLPCKSILATYVPFFVTINDCHPLARMSFCDCIITGVYFPRLKINHESHEFILDTGTVANNTSY
jgi:hypothetical protein